MIGNQFSEQNMSAETEEWVSKLVQMHNPIPKRMGGLC